MGARFDLPTEGVDRYGGWSGDDSGRFVVDLAMLRWFVVKAELAVHSVWSHIAPLVAKEVIAARTLTELVVNLVKENPKFLEQFKDFEIAEIDIRRLLWEIFEARPIVGISIDEVSVDLREWAQTAKADVKLWLVCKLVEFGNPSHEIYEVPDESTGQSWIVRRGCGITFRTWAGMI